MSVIPKCEVCGGSLRFETDWIGRAFFFHDGPCKPITATWKVPCDVKSHHRFLQPNMEK